MWTAQLDTGATRIASGSPETFANINPNMQSTETSDLVVKGGAITVGAESASCRVLVTVRSVRASPSRAIGTGSTSPTQF